MLQNIRDSLKGTIIAGVVFILFIVPLVLTSVGGDGGSYLGSAAGTDAANVEGVSITKQELNRAVYLRKQRLLQQQGIDPSSEFLKDENLRAPVLESLTRRAALVVAAKQGGMGVSTEALDQQIVRAPEFQKDGKFDPATYEQLLRGLGYTSASYKLALSEDELLNQHSAGVDVSSFATGKELEDIVALVQQKRSFYTLTIDKSTVEKEVNISDEEVAAYYEANQAQYLDPEKMSAQYVELSVAKLTEQASVSEEEVKAQFESELAQFQGTDTYEVAHILIENKDGEEKAVAEVAAKIAAGEDFAELVKQYSDDVGSKENGGKLGVVTKGMFPEAFENAVYSLEQGQVSPPVETDAGTHFVKVLTKTVTEPPSFEERRAIIEQQLKTALAEQTYRENLDRLGELTFNSPDLSDVAKALGVEVDTTATFTRDEGTGLAANAAFRAEAFSDEVLNQGYNSKVVELSNSQAVVLRKAGHSPERIKGLDEVKTQIIAALKAEKIEERLTALADGAVEKLRAGSSAEDLSKAEGYSYKSYTLVDRASADAGFQVIGKAFSMSLAEESKVGFESVSDRNGNKVVIGLTAIAPGTKADMPEQQFVGLSAQLKQQNARFEGASYESQVVANTDIDIY